MERADVQNRPRARLQEEGTTRVRRHPIEVARGERRVLALPGRGDVVEFARPGSGDRPGKRLVHHVADAAPPDARDGVGENPVVALADPHDDRLDGGGADVHAGREAHVAAPRRAKCAAPSAPV